jgi:hypothetical protein
MAFEPRGKSGKFFYLAYRDEETGKVKKAYLGRGPWAQSVAAALEKRAKRREADRLAVDAARSELRVVDGLMGDLDAAATLLLDAVLLTAGFHRVNFGPWRKRRTHTGQERQKTEISIKPTDTTN